MNGAQQNHGNNKCYCGGAKTWAFALGLNPTL